MPRGKRIALAGGVILAGIGAAVMFRKQPDETPEAPLAAEIPVKTQRPAMPRAPSPESVPRLLGPIDAVESTSKSPAEPPSGEPAVEPASARAGSLSVTDTKPPLRKVKHKVRDGETLISLARRYLGDGARYQEILNANRRLLPKADVLPIGVEIEIPIGPPPPPAEAPDTRPLVPIP
jgi:nucleoid-associated protein YgaU